MAVKYVHRPPRPPTALHFLPFLRRHRIYFLLANLPTIGFVSGMECLWHFGWVTANLWILIIERQLQQYSSTLETSLPSLLMVLITSRLKELRSDAAPPLCADDTDLASIDCARELPSDMMSPSRLKPM